MEKEKPISYEQTPEQIREILDRALREKRHVDLVILSLAGEPKHTPDLIVEEIKNINSLIPQGGIFFKNGSSEPFFD